MTTDYVYFAGLVRQVCALRPAWGGRSKRIDNEVHEATLRQLACIEQMMVDSLKAEGVGDEIARLAACSFLQQCVAQYSSPTTAH